MKNRNLFIELNLPAEKVPLGTLINSWTKPPPMEFHMLQSPSLTHSIAELIPKEHKTQYFNPTQLPQKTPKRGRNKERKKYRRLQEEINFLESFLRDFKDLHQSQLLMYRQTLLIKYLNGFVEQMKTECQEKAHFIRSIWNVLIRIFQQLFERVVSQSKKKEKKMLSSEIQMHYDYQDKIEEINKNNEDLIIKQGKYQESMQKLIDSIGELNVELKGTRVLQQKSAYAHKQLSHKYEELRADYLDLTMMTGMSRSKAESLLNDKELLLFSKQVANNQVEVKVRQMDKRKTRKMGCETDIVLILEDIQAQDEHQFQFKHEQPKQVKFQSKRVQTLPLGSYLKQDVDIQTGYFQLSEEGLIRNRTVQTDKERIIVAFNAEVQTIIAQIHQETQTVSRTGEHMNIVKIDDCQVIIKPGKMKKQYLNAASDLNFKNTEEKINSKISLISNKQSNKSIDFNHQILAKFQKDTSILNKLRDSKMFRVGEASRASSRTSKRSSGYRQKLMRTQGNQDSQRPSVIKKRGSASSKRRSEFLLLDELKKTMMGKKSKFGNASGNFLQQIKEEVPDHLVQVGYNSLVELEISTQGNQKSSTQNIQLSKVNASIYQKVTQATVNKNYFVAGKCMRIAADIMRNFSNFVSEGVDSLNIVPFAIEYMGIIKGQIIQKQVKQNTFCQFAKACIPLSASSYLIKNFFFLCGFPLKNRTSKIILVSNQEGIYNHNLSNYMFSSEVLTYFRFLSKVNCEPSLDLLQASTNGETLIQSLQMLTPLYGNSEELIEETKRSIENILDTTSQEQPKLDIFKSLQLILDKILQKKMKISHQIQSLARLYQEPDDHFFSQILSLLCNNPDKILLSLRTNRLLYDESNSPENISSLALIEGFKLKIDQFIQIENQFKFNVLKRLLTSSPKSKMLAAMVKAIPKRQLKRSEFLVLLKLIWVHRYNQIQRQILGADLMNLNMVATAYSMQKPQTKSFHNLYYDICQ